MINVDLAGVWERLSRKGVSPATCDHTAIPAY